ncbi:IclR family transcriptional regulator [Tamaricihabitans halophyticus]|uniref:IclR family transcriptional regulator n=1 Tax=Tamaricihabitans halophyticus TaxID=1262583 RepID=A0A4R2QLT3_9PSEU|nr:IclR family transcriptional regulator [Tamaricihabitans halophyticus]TCP47955.1 IclR family transcriptional regulator [Tamaricihabitans halophyticus]
MVSPEQLDVGEVRAPAVRQAFLILDALADAERGLRLTELVDRVALPKSTTHRILHTLCQLGGVVRSERSGTYRLGERLATYSESIVGVHSGLLGVFYPLAERFRQEYDETIQLGVLTGTDVTFIGYLDSAQPVRLDTRIGRRLPAHASAAGKAILAFRPGPDLELVLATGLPARTERTVTEPRLLRRQLAEVRASGRALEVEESSANLSCFAAPVRDSRGRARAALTVCVPNNAVPADRAGALLDQVGSLAAEMSRRLYGQPIEQEEAG